MDLEITYREILFFTSIVFSFFLVSPALRHAGKAWIRRLLICLSLLYLAAAFFMVLADVVHYLIFAAPITLSAVQTVLNTNPEEAQGFIRLYTSAGTLAAVLMFVLALPLIVFKRAWLLNLFSTRSFFITCLLVAAFGIADFGQMAHSRGNGTHNVRYWDIVIGEYNEYREFNRLLAADKNTHNLSEEYKSFYQRQSALRRGCTK